MILSVTPGLYFQNRNRIKRFIIRPRFIDSSNVMPNILVADKIAEPGLERLRAEGVSFDIKHGLTPEELAQVVGSYDGMLIRSAVKVTRETLANPGKLAAIARAGVGVDNIDLQAATDAGVLVLNTPDANTIATAEHAMAMLLALHRRIPDAHASVKIGEWNRSAFQGKQLKGKTLGIIGYGRIGRAVAIRALSFDMNVVAYDPFIATGMTEDETVKLISDLSEFLKQVDCITLHASLSDATKHIICEKTLSEMKPGAKLINCARGGLVDEVALANALNSEHLSGAAIDVYEVEPPTDSPLLTAKNIVMTPHLGASTSEAQAQVSADAADALLAYLLNGEIRSAVNVTGMPQSMTPRHRAFIDLCSRMGALLSPWCAGGVERIRLEVFGESIEEMAATLSWQAMVSVLDPHVEDRLNMVNAKDHAKKRGIVVEHTVHPPARNQPDTIVITTEAKGEQHTIEGTVFVDNKPRVISIDGYSVDIIPERSIALIFNDDKPGVIGLVGQRVGNAGINIADMALSRRGQTALMVLKLDDPMPEDLRDSLRDSNPPILSLQTVTLPPVAEGNSGS